MSAVFVKYEWEKQSASLTTFGGSISVLAFKFVKRAHWKTIRINARIKTSEIFEDQSWAIRVVLANNAAILAFFIATFVFLMIYLNVPRCS